MKQEKIYANLLKKTIKRVSESENSLTLFGYLFFEFLTTIFERANSAITFGITMR